MMRKTHTVNERFFSEWSSEMAYILGYLYADGYMDRDKYRIRLASKDKQILEDIKGKLNYSGELKSCSNKQGEWLELHIQNKQIYSDLRKLGIYPNKSLTMRFPEIPKEVLPHFIRGYFDGDGCIYEVKRKRPTPGLETDFATGSKEFAKSLLEILNKIYPKFRLYNKRANYYCIRGANYASYALYEYMYKDNPICLQSKYDKFQDIISRKYASDEED